MKYVILRCEDTARGGEQLVSLLAGAKTPHLAHLAQAGAAGTILAPGEQGLDRAQLHRALLGVKADDRAVSPGAWYAASANLTLAEGETAWCSELVTQQDGQILDPSAGNIPTKESSLLIQALDDALGSDTRRWEVGHGPHHVLITREPALAADGQQAVRSPELLIGQPWQRQLPKGRQGEALRAIVEQASRVLESHPVNRVRVDLGENPANLLWLWGASTAGPGRTFTDHTGLTGTMLSRSFLTRGLARTLGLGWHEAPASFDEAAFQRLLKAAEAALERHDLLYLHLGITTADPVDRLCAMERIDRLLLKPLTESLQRGGSWRLLAAIDDRPQRRVPVVAIGTGLPRQPIPQLDAESFSGSPLTFPDATGLFAWLTSPLVR